MTQQNAAPQPTAPGYPFPRAQVAQMEPLKAGVQRTFRFYVYNIFFSNLAANAPQTNFTKIDAKFRFMCYGLAAMFYNPTTGLGNTQQQTRLRISDTTSGVYWSNAPIMMGAMTGYNNAYYRFPVPLVLERNTKIQADITPITVTAGVTDLALSFIGAQIAEYS